MLINKQSLEFQIHSMVTSLLSKGRKVRRKCKLSGSQGLLIRPVVTEDEGKANAGKIQKCLCLHPSYEVGVGSRNYERVTL